MYYVGSGYPFNQLGIQCSRAGFSGLEFAGGIPGTVGGAIYMNAGADGQVWLCLPCMSNKFSALGPLIISSKVFLSSYEITISSWMNIFL